MHCNLASELSRIDPDDERWLWPCLAGELARIEAEKAAIHAEYEQERIAYQRLIKDFHRVEQQCENLQVPQCH